MLEWGILLVGVGAGSWFTANAVEEWCEKHRPWVVSVNACLALPFWLTAAWALTHG